MESLIDVISTCLIKIQREKERLVEEIKAYKDILYSINIKEDDLNYIKSVWEKVASDSTLDEVNTTTPITTFLRNLIKDKKSKLT